MRAEGKKAAKLIVAILIAVGVIAVIVGYLSSHDIAVLEPKGTIASSERNLIFLALALCAIVVLPVFYLTIFIALKYREGNKKAKKYRPEWSSDRRFELTWWAIPIAIITVLGIVAWTSSYRLDPFKPLSAAAAPLNIKVISLDWKWLFIYPQQNIASINYLRLPVNTPVSLDLTSDSVMNSFWLPDLAGQMYTMPGMSTQLHLMADKVGSFHGSSANISGQGFAQMGFTAAASSQADFNNWVDSVKRSSLSLNVASYNQLARPSTSGPVYYASTQNGLYDWVVMKYMQPNMKAPMDMGMGQVAQGDGTPVTKPPEAVLGAQTTSSDSGMAGMPGMSGMDMR